MNEIKDKILEFFSGIHLDEASHKYTLGNETFKISVSGLIKPYYYPTDWEKVKLNVSNSRGISIEDVEKEWKQAADEGCAIGDKTHIFGENYVLSGFNLKPTTGYEKAIVNFWKDLPDFIIPIVLEAKMYHKKYRFAGTSDILLYDTRDNSIIIADYKTNKDLFKNFNDQRMQYPFSYLKCSPFGHYTLQLSYYQILLEQVPGVKVKNRRLIWLKADGTYAMYDTDNVTEELKKELLLNGI